MTPQDPYVVLSLDKWSARTPHQDEAGTSAVWDNVEGMQTSVTGDVLKFKRLNVSVYDKDNLSTDELIGEGDASLRRIGTQVSLLGGKEIVVPIDVKIRNKRGAKCGEVKVYAVLHETVVQDDEVQDINVVEGTLRIQKIEAVNVKGGGAFADIDTKCSSAYVMKLCSFA